MDAQGKMRQDLRLPNETDEDNKLSERIRAYIADGKEISVTVMSSMKTEKVVDVLENIEK